MYSYVWFPLHLKLTVWQGNQSQLKTLMTSWGCNQLQASCLSGPAPGLPQYLEPTLVQSQGWDQQSVVSPSPGMTPESGTGSVGPNLRGTHQSADFWSQP